MADAVKMKRPPFDLVPPGKRESLLRQARAYLNDSIIDARREEEITEHQADCYRAVMSEYQYLLQVSTERGLDFGDVLIIIGKAGQEPTQQATASRQGSKVADLSRHAS